jgi:hypothetical protein
VSAEQLKAWIADGRASAQTKVQAEGQTEWKALIEYPELALLLGIPETPGAPPAFPAATPVVSGPDALQQVQGPAVGLIVTAALGLLAAVAGLLMNTLGITMGAAGMQGSEDMPEWINMMSGGLGIVQSILGLAMSVLILLGALKMKKLENYTFSIIATVVAMVPCISPCCLVGLPIGIWALVVLNKPEVKSAFH